MPLARRAIDLDPLSVNPNMTLGVALAFAGRMDEAVRQFRRVIAMQPGFVFGSVWLCAVLAMLGQGEESLAVAERMMQVTGEAQIARAALAVAYGVTGRIAEAQQIQADLRGGARQAAVSACDDLRHHRRRRDGVRLAGACIGGPHRHVHVARASGFRADARAPRFVSLLERVGLR